MSLYLTKENIKVNNSKSPIKELHEQILKKKKLIQILNNFVI